MDVPVSYFVYSSFSFFAPSRGGELPGLWFTGALAEVGCDEDAVRQTLYRMEKSGELVSRRAGREKFYTPTGYARGEITAGFGKIFDEPEPWDGRWTFLHARFEKEDRVHRDRLQELLRVEGFAPVAPGFHVHPRPRGERVLEAVEPEVRDSVVVVRGDRIGSEPQERFIARHWDLPALALRYREAIRELERLQDRAGRGFGDAEAFRLRFEVVIRFLRVAWDDPDLPPELLPEPWPGERARELAAELYRTFLPGALRFGDSVLVEAGHADRAASPAADLALPERIRP